MSRTRGPMCASEVGPDWIDTGTLSRTHSAPRAPSGGQPMPEADRELLLDLGQMVLDLTGIVDPTPVSDGSNALISIARGDWVGAGISSVSMVPFIGDLAKAGKIGRWAQTVHKCIDLARRNARFADRARPVLRRLATLLDQVPVSSLAKPAQAALQRMKHELGGWLGLGARFTRLQLLEAYAREWHGYVARLQFPALAPGQGALWSKVPDGAAGARRMAQSQNKQTLEMMLEDFGVEERYKLAWAQLLEKLGDSEEVKADMWQHFGRPVWEQLSKKYTLALQGEVTAFVRFHGERGLLSSGRGAYTAENLAKDPVLFDELDFITDAMVSNNQITRVKLVDQQGGLLTVLDRSEVLRHFNRSL